MNKQVPFVKVVPWLEIYDVSPQTLSNARTGLMHWRKVTDTAIITTQSRFIDEVYDAVTPAIKYVIGGVTGWYHAGGATWWQILGKKLARCRLKTRVPLAMAQLEGHLREVIDPEEYGPEFDVPLALSSLVYGGTVWYPGIFSNDPKRRLNEIAFHTAVGMSSYTRKQTWMNGQFWKPLDTKREQVGKWTRLLHDEFSNGLELQPYVFYFWDHKENPDPQEPWWGFDQAMDTLYYLVEDERYAVFYPHSAHWVSGAEAITTNLLDNGYVPPNIKVF